MQRIIGKIILLTTTLLVLSAPAAATDLLVGPGTIKPSVPLTAGQTYTLPTHEITNNSNSPLEISVSISEHRDKERTLPPAEWFSIDPKELIVQARSEENVQVLVELPSDAPPGQYKVWFLFDAIPLGSGGLTTAAAINVSLEFVIRDKGQAGDTPGSPENQSEFVSGTRIPWALLIMVLLTLTVGLVSLLVYHWRRHDRW